jgi:hypothetical protein
MQLPQDANAVAEQRRDVDAIVEQR